MKEAQICEHCGAKMRKYKVRATVGIIRALIKFRRAVHQKNLNNIHIYKDMEGDNKLTTAEQMNWTKLRFLGLIAKYKENGLHISGHWVLTKRGAEFLNGKTAIPAYVMVFRNKIVERSEEEITITGVMKDESIPYFENIDTIEYHSMEEIEQFDSREPRTSSERTTTVPMPQMRPQEHGGRKITAYVSEYYVSYIVNENKKGFKMTLAGYGSCTPADVMQNWIDNLSIENWEKLYQQCENGKLWPF